MRRSGINAGHLGVVVRLASVAILALVAMLSTGANPAANRGAGVAVKTFTSASAALAQPAGPPQPLAPTAANEGAGVSLPTSVGQEWWAAAQQEIAASEYRATWQERAGAAGEGAYQAPNRAHNLRTTFTPAGIELAPRTGEHAAWRCGLTLVAVGLGGVSQKVVPATPVANGNRVEYRRGALTEWYVNDARGLEQGFTIEAPPPGAAGVQLRLDLAVAGDLTPELAADEQAVDLLGAGGARAVRYAGLAVTDARGTVLPARMGLSGCDEEQTEAGCTLHLLASIGGATWPITVDPLATSPSWTAESDRAGAKFGSSVASAGDVNGDGYADVIVGAYDYDNGLAHQGRAYLYHGSASGPGNSANWEAENGFGWGYFGYSVAGAGDVNGDGYSDIVIGSPPKGRAYVYHGSAAGLSTAANWVAVCDQGDAWFGVSVASAGDVNGDGYADVIVGALNYDNGEENEGRAFVYRGSASGLSPTPSWTAESDQVNGAFGNDVAGAGDVNGDSYADVIVGAHGYDNGEEDEGRAFVYHGSASGLSQTTNWSAEGDQGNARFGGTVAGSGDVNGDGYADVLIGASNYSNGEASEGRAFVYHGSPSGLSSTPSWSAESNQVGAFFGTCVASAGDLNGDGHADVIVGAGLYTNGQANEGRAFVYLGSASGLSPAANWTAESNQAGASFGWSVAGAGDVNGDGYADVIVGADSYDNGQSDEGRAFVYHGSASGFSPSANWSAESDQVNTYYANSVAGAGDVNGDGYADVIVGARQYDNGQNREGRAFVYHGSAVGLSTTANWTAESNVAWANFGWSVAGAGDVNGDSYADIVVGAYGFANGQSAEGRAFVYHGSASGLVTTPNWSVESNQADAYYGCSVAGAGDVNGDGYTDIIVGAYQYSNGEYYEGSAFVYHGSASGLSTAANWNAEGDQESARFGTSVAGAGDVNGDGYADIIVGASFYDNGVDNEGRAVVYHGSASGLSTTANWTAESDESSAFFGNSVASAGDVNGDGFADVVVGAEYSNAGQTDGGRAVVYHGSATGLSPTASWSAVGNGMSVYFGHCVAGAGDVNGDGYADVIVGADGYHNAMTNEGGAFVYHGSAAGLAATPSSSAEGDQVDAEFGTSVAGAGDVNGDGYADVIVGAQGFSNGQSDEGRAFVFYGNAGSGRAVVAQQLDSSGASALQPWGKLPADTFQVRSRHSSPFGRERVKVEIEGCPTGVPFGHASCLRATSANWSDSTATASGVLLTQSLSGLTRETLYRWRERTLRAPYSVTLTGVSAPQNPAHGPWRRLQGQAFDADIRTGSTHTLTVGRIGTGSGTVTSAPAGISCGATCSATYAYNTPVTLTAVAAGGSGFTGWSGAGCSGTGTCQVTMSAARSVVATFDLPYTLTVTKTGAGTGTVTSSPAGISCGATCAHAFAQSTVVTLTASAASSLSFAGWSGEGCSGLGTCVVTMGAGRSVQAMFIVKTATGFVPVTPCRLIDTRVDSGPSAGAPILAPDSRRVFSLLGKCGLVSWAKAISGNLTVVGATVQGDLQVIGGHLNSTDTSQLSIPISRARANNAIVQLSVDSLQTIAVINTTAGSVHFILDINGYFL
jgi:hypothetical protein